MGASTQYQVNAEDEEQLAARLLGKHANSEVHETIANIIEAPDFFMAHKKLQKVLSPHPPLLQCN
jgi:hypothetical protein